MKLLFFEKVPIFLKKRKDIFSDSGGSSRSFDYLFIFLGLTVKLLINYLQHHVEFTKNMNIMSTLNFETPLTAKSGPSIKKYI